VTDDELTLYLTLDDEPPPKPSGCWAVAIILILTLLYILS
jgi:hypothetical protein